MSYVEPLSGRALFIYLRRKGLKVLTLQALWAIFLIWTALEAPDNIRLLQIDADPSERLAQFYAPILLPMSVACLAHDVFARQVVAAFPDDLTGVVAMMRTPLACMESPKPSEFVRAILAKVDDLAGPPDELFERHKVLKLPVAARVVEDPIFSRLEEAVHGR